MIPTMILFGLICGHWWKTSMVAGTLGWPLVLLATDLIHSPEVLGAAGGGSSTRSAAWRRISWLSAWSVPPTGIERLQRVIAPDTLSCRRPLLPLTARTPTRTVVARSTFSAPARSMPSSMNFKASGGNDMNGLPLASQTWARSASAARGNATRASAHGARALDRRRASGRWDTKAGLPRLPPRTPHGVRCRRWGLGGCPNPACSASAVSPVILQ